MATVTRKKGRKSPPLHEVVKADILDLIAEQGLVDGDRLPQMRELAKLFGVSYVTASRAVALLVDSGVLVSRVGDGTYVKQGAVSSANSATPQRTIAAVVRDVYQLELFNLGASIRTIGEFSNNNNLKMQMLIVHEDESTVGVETLLREIVDQNVDGLIIASRVDPRLIIRLKEKRIPFVWIGDELPHHDTHSVVGAKVGGSLSVMRAMRELNHNKIAFITEPFWVSAAEAVRADAASRGQDFDPASLEVCPQGDRDAVREATDRLLDAGYDAFICLNEQLAGWSQERALELGKAIPGDLLYATFAPPSSNFNMPAPYITVCAPIEKMAQEACRLLLRLLEGEENPAYQQVFDVNVLIPKSIRGQ